MTAPCPAGPFATRAEAMAVPAVRGALDEAHYRQGALADHNRAMICAALTGGGVELGAFDRRIAEWLATWEPHVIAVIAGWITRAGSGRQAAHPEGSGE